MPWMTRWQGRGVAGKFTEVTLGVIKVPHLSEPCQQRGMRHGAHRTRKKAELVSCRLPWSFFCPLVAARERS